MRFVLPLRLMEGTWLSFLLLGARVVLFRALGSLLPTCHPPGTLEWMDRKVPDR